MSLTFADNQEWDCNESEGDTWACDKSSSKNKINKSTSEEVTQKSTENTISLPKPAPAPIQKPSVSTKPPQNLSDNLGWNCFSSDGEQSWNCRLKGADPEGKALSVEDESKKSFSLFSDAFDFQEEQDFQLLEARLAYNPWKSCLSSQKHPRYIKDESIRESEPMDVTADYSEVFDKEITGFFGNVKMSRADQKITADRASYDAGSETMDLQGHIFYTESDISLHSDTALLNLATDEARLRNTLFISPSGPLRGKADVVYRDSKVLSRYNDAAFTSCRPGNQDWIVHSGRFKMNKQSGLGSAKHAWLEFKGVPVFYTPYVAFPLDDRRMTGFLTPKYGGNSTDTGFDITIPYYWNIAPNYDLTVWPRYMTKRGAMLGGEFRYQNKITEQIRTVGEIGVEYLPYDWVHDDSRYSGTFRNHTKLSPNLAADIDLNYVSDKEYFDELSDSLGMRGFSQPQGYTNTLQGITQDRFLQSHASLNYSGKGVSFATRAESYKTIDNDVKEKDKPYYKLPEVTLNLNHSFEQWPIDVGIENEYVNFYRKSRTSGHRFNIKPFVTVPIESAGAFFKPKFSLQHTQYYLDDEHLESGKSKNITRVSPIVSVDTGLIFERDFKFANSGFLHTIEPRLFYLFIPKIKQDNVTIFDSAEYDFSYGSLFRENRFSGNDIVQDANQITLAVSSSLLDSDTGEERLKLSVGEILYFRDREVRLTDNSEADELPNLVTTSDEQLTNNLSETYGWSNLVAELSGKITDNWSFSTGIQWNPQINDVTRGHAEVTYRDINEPGHIINLGYRYRNEQNELNKIENIIQTDASFRWPIYDNWFAVGRWQYSLKHNKTKDSFLGLEKESCCWRFRIIWRRYANSLNDPEDVDSFGQMEEGFFVQMELKGFGAFGNNADEFLEQNLNGYQRTE